MYEVKSEDSQRIENYECCAQKPEDSSVKIQREPMVIPTYPAHDPDPNPIFFETRITQGTKGNVYPLPLTDRLSDEKVDKTYDAVNLENEYIKLTVLPEMGGKIYAAMDKTNDYNFIYRNNVIKPALIGLCGPWISGGIEFNWPQHHRPTTFMPVDCTIEENEDGSKTVWTGEVEPLYRTKGMVGVTVHPGKSYIQAKVRLYNRTPFPQSFLWWANLAVHVNENYKAMFPPDIDYVTFHAKTHVSEFPKVNGQFAGADYGDGVDITWYKNVGPSASFFIFNSNYNFMGGYDTGKGAGVVHIANNQISAGKKVFTWGVSEFGERWCHNLTDSDGPYIEIMTGVYTDNQPDFAWLQPYETKTFEQYWYPVKDIGIVKNANIDGAVSLKVEGSTAKIGFYTTGKYENAAVILKKEEQILFEQKIDVSPDKPYVTSVEIPEGTKEEELYAGLISCRGLEIIGYKFTGMYHTEKPKPVPPPKRPSEISTNEELFLNGLHLEQYKHPTIEPEPYYEEALRREPGDYRCNNAMGLKFMRRGLLQKAEGYFKKAIETLIQRNPNPYDSEAYYNLGLVQKYMGKYDEAYKAFYKASWNYAWKSPAYHCLAEINCLRGELLKGLDHVNMSLATNTESLRTRGLKAAILRKLGKLHEAEELCISTMEMDKLDFRSRYELHIIKKLQGKSQEAENILNEMKAMMRGQGEAYIDMAIDYGYAGFYCDAIELLSVVADQTAPKAYPMVYYYMGYYSELEGDRDGAIEYYRLAESSPSDYCFPSRLDSIAVLKAAQNANSEGAKAYYYLGNLLYDKRRYDPAIENWEKSRELDDGFAIVHRNLARAYFEKKNDVVSAKTAMEKAFKVNPVDSRLLYELHQFYRNTNVPAEERLELLNKYSELVDERDDLYLEKVAIYTFLGKYDEAERLLSQRHFHPYEGGEGVPSRLHMTNCLEMGKEYLKNKEYDKAIEAFENSIIIPMNYGEGKHFGMQLANVNYYLGLAYEESGNTEKAREYYTKAANDTNGRFKDMDYYQAMGLLRIGCVKAAKSILNELIDYAEKELEKGGKLGYTTNTPTIKPFDYPLEVRNEIMNRYLLGLGYKGLGKTDKAAEEFNKILQFDMFHLSVKTHIKEMEM